MRKALISIIFIIILASMGACQKMLNTTQDEFGFQLLNFGDNAVYQVTGYLGAETEIMIPNLVNGRKVIAISNGAFSETNLTKVTIPNSIDSIMSRAFMDCKDLKDVSFPDNNVSIHTECFKGCISLEQITIKSAYTIHEKAFENCTSLKQVSLTDVFIIANNAFVGCSALENLTLINVKMIDGEAFSRCTSLKKLYIDNNMINIGKDAFSGCTDLEIYLEVPQKTESWSEDWKTDIKAVHFGVAREDFDKLG